MQAFFSVTIGAFYLGQSTTNFGNLITAAATAVPIFETIDRVCTIIIILLQLWSHSDKNYKLYSQ